MISIFKGPCRVKYNINITNEKVGDAYIRDDHLDLLRNAEDKLEEIRLNISNIILTIDVDYTDPRALHEVYILEGSYITKFMFDRATYTEAFYIPEHIYKLSMEDKMKVDVLMCRSKLTQNNLEHLSTKGTKIL